MESKIKSFAGKHLIVSTRYTSDFKRTVNKKKKIKRKVARSSNRRNVSYAISVTYPCSFYIDERNRDSTHKTCRTMIMIEPVKGYTVLFRVESATYCVTTCEFSSLKRLFFHTRIRYVDHADIHSAEEILPLVSTVRYVTIMLALV